MTEFSNDSIVSFIQEVIIDAGSLILKIQQQPFQLSYKNGVMDIVTDADIRSNNLIISRIKDKFPNHGIVSEESANLNSDADYIWYIDPLDGTNNFASRIPLWGISIALAYKGIIQYASIYLPETKDLSFAKAGFGTFLNGKKIRYSSNKTWNGVYGIMPVKYSTQNTKFEKQIDEISNGTAWFNKIASPAVSAIWVADSRRSFYISKGKNSWDFAASCLICKEAGCFVKDYFGNDWKIGSTGFIVSSPKIAKQLIRIVKDCYLSDTEKEIIST
jgi:myo-inositol-1(or 4)-monophosphatase